MEVMNMVNKISQNDFQNVLQSKVALIDFSATWCGPCQMLAPVLEKVSENMAGQVDFYAVDVDESPDLAGQFGIQGVPTLIMIKDGRPVDMQVGFVPQDQLESFIKKHLG